MTPHMSHKRFFESAKPRSSRSQITNAMRRITAIGRTMFIQSISRPSAAPHRTQSAGFFESFSCLRSSSLTASINSSSRQV